SRIRLLVNFMKLVYLDKKERARAWMGSHRAILTFAAVIVFALLPICRQSTRGNFVLAPSHRIMVRSVVPGRLEDVYVDEGSRLPTFASFVPAFTFPSTTCTKCATGRPRKCK